MFRAFLAGLARVLHHIIEGQFATIEEIHMAVTVENLVPSSPFRAEVTGRRIALASSHVEVVYREMNRADGRHVETVFVKTLSKRTALTTTFVQDGRLIQITYAGRELVRDKLSADDMEKIEQILYLVRRSLSQPPAAA